MQPKETSKAHEARVLTDKAPEFGKEVEGGKLEPHRSRERLKRSLP
jgi:hypothetical protein